LDQLLIFAQHAAALAAVGLCAAAGLVALDPARSRTATAARFLAAAALGSAIWAAPFLAAAWPAAIAFNPVLLAASLACAGGASVFAMIARDHGEGDNLRIIGPGAILGAGAGLSHGALLMAIGGAGDATFDDDAFSAGVAIASACAVLAFVFLSRSWRHAGPLAAASLAIGTTACAMLADSALALPSSSAHGGLAVPIGAMMLFAPALVVVLILAAVWRGRVRPATRAPAWRGSRRLSPAPSRAETVFPHRATGRSAAGRAAGLGHPGQPVR
jgi:NO-binding membrane sensor protein with MHYT domain